MTVPGPVFQPRVTCGLQAAVLPDADFTAASAAVYHSGGALCCSLHCSSFAGSLSAAAHAAAACSRRSALLQPFSSRVGLLEALHVDAQYGNSFHWECVVQGCAATVDRPVAGKCAESFASEPAKNFSVTAASSPLMTKGAFTRTRQAGSKGAA